MNDYLWSNGTEEIAATTFKAAFQVWQERGQTGKLWRRVFAADGLLEGVTDITPVSMSQTRRLEHQLKNQ